MLSPRLTGSGLLLVFLAGVMCLCGTFGYQHAVVSGPAEPTAIHALAVQPSFASDRQDDHGKTGAVYTAALFAVSLGAALGLLLGGGRKQARKETPPLFRRLSPTIVFLLRRTPVRSQLQVFIL